MNGDVGLIQAVAFDLDGLMFNTEDLYTHVADVMLSRRGHRLDMELIHRMMGLPARVGLPLMIEWYELPETVTQLEEETRQIFHEILPARLRPMPGLETLIQYLDEREMPKAIVTSSRRSYVEHILQLANLPTEFRFLVTADDVRQGKPHPEAYWIAAQRFGIEPRRMLVLEDSHHGCQAGVASGAVTIAIPGSHNGSKPYCDVHACVSTLHDPQVFELLACGLPV